ncbi:acyltransferase family protein [Flagellimonas meridianipacifica]|uniref:Acyltransferase-like protein n=1 Tax=Flagellimonas meridianipacifica TaxID=1080225 RepID=A0A2T0MG07_9FLAO|nr:acyltransferase family protein [Allomuricauda pacifica]PRX56510.1 acyltransferase-like protein [Allomuricauda pacifica]
MKTTIRRHDLDWLRVIVFALLILYHVGMFFVPWGWHIKNNEIYEWLRWPMLFLNQWRLPILFVISGMGTYYALGKRSTGKFVLERYLRLGIPLAVGMLLIVPPQVYFERLANGAFQGSYFEYYTSIAFKGIYPEGNLSWHHLWFLPYLFLFSLLLAPLFVYLRNHDTAMIKNIGRIMNTSLGMYVFIVPLYFIEVLVEPFFPVNHALIGDWFTISFYIVLFFSGFILIATGDVFWINLNNVKKKALYIGSGAFLTLLFIWLFLEDSTLVHFIEGFVKVVNLWSWILVLFAYAVDYLNKPSKLLAYSNRAVYPFYILHQTITVGIAYYLMDLKWGFWSKASVLVIGTFGLSWLVYHFIILQIPLIQPLFGVKRKKAH